MFSLRLEWMRSATSFDTTTSLQTSRTTEVVTLQATSMSYFIVSESGSTTVLLGACKVIRQRILGKLKL